MADPDNAPALSLFSNAAWPDARAEIDRNPSLVNLSFPQSVATLFSQAGDFVRPIRGEVARVYEIVQGLIRVVKSTSDSVTSLRVDFNKNKDANKDAVDGLRQDIAKLTAANAQQETRLVELEKGLTIEKEDKTHIYSLVQTLQTLVDEITAKHPVVEAPSAAVTVAQALAEEITYIKRHLEQDCEVEDGATPIITSMVEALDLIEKWPVYDERKVSDKDGMKHLPESPMKPKGENGVGSSSKTDAAVASSHSPVASSSKRKRGIEDPSDENNSLEPPLPELRQGPRALSVTSSSVPTTATFSTFSSENVPSPFDDASRFSSPLTDLDDVDIKEAGVASIPAHSSMSAPLPVKKKHKGDRGISVMSSASHKKGKAGHPSRNIVHWKQVRWHKPINSHEMLRKKFIECTKCTGYLHATCAGLTMKKLTALGRPNKKFICPECEAAIENDANFRDRSSESQCFRRDCSVAEESDAFVVNAIVGRKRRENGAWVWLVKWDGYPMHQATWEPDEEGQMKGFIDEFNKAAILEHHDVTTSFNILLNDAEKVFGAVQQADESLPSLSPHRLGDHYAL